MDFVLVHTDKERVIALAGVVQSAKLVHMLALSGKIDDMTLFSSCIGSLFILDPQRVDSVYNHRAILSGVGALKAVLMGKEAENGQPYILRYTFDLVRLGLKLQRKEEMQTFIRKRIAQAYKQKCHFDQTNVAALLNHTFIYNLASTYKESISTLKPRIHVFGKPQHLQSDVVANKIRALLLAGIRSVVLWRQVGGRGWHLIFFRKRFLRVINSQFDVAMQ